MRPSPGCTPPHAALTSAAQSLTTPRCCAIAVEPQVFDLLHYLVRNRDRVVTKDDLIAAVWKGRIISESTLTSRITAVRHAIADRAEDQRLLRTIARKGLRFIGEVKKLKSNALCENPPAA